MSSWGLREVTVTRGHAEALAGVTVPVDQAGVTVVVGGDGAGKSTCLQVLAGLLQPSLGTVLRPPKELIGYVPATAGLYADLTVQENLDFSASAYRMAGRDCRQRAEALLEQTGLGPARRRLGGQLSGGMQRKLAVAMALLHAPALLLLDEPTSGVGPLGGARLWEGIRQAAAAGAGALVTTHNMEEAEQCDRLMIMVDGKVVASGTAQDITAGRDVAEVRAADWGRAFALLDDGGFSVQLHGTTLRSGGQPAEISALLSRAGLDAAVESVPANLEEAFVEIVSQPAAR